MIARLTTILILDKFQVPTHLLLSRFSINPVPLPIGFSSLSIQPSAHIVDRRVLQAFASGIFFFVYFRIVSCRSTRTFLWEPLAEVAVQDGFICEFIAVLNASSA